jgi:hypothetical protein
MFPRKWSGSERVRERKRERGLGFQRLLVPHIDIVRWTFEDADACMHAWCMHKAVYLHSPLRKESNWVCVRVWGEGVCVRVRVFVCVGPG